MYILPRIRRSSDGSSLVVVTVIGGIASITIASMLTLSSYSYRSAHGRNDWTAAFFHSENALQWMAQTIFENPTPLASSNFYSTANGSLGLSYMTSPSAHLDGAWVRAVQLDPNLPDSYEVTASSRVRDKVRTVRAIVQKNAPNRVFDYEYFLNNWGWWWGSSITGNGPNRSNWEFDFRYNPVVNGNILANGSITENGTPVDVYGSTPFRGMAGSSPLEYVHGGAPRMSMPNLKDFSYYQAKAEAQAATAGIWVGGNRLVYGIHTNAAAPGLYLEGTTANPIVINQLAVVPGDVVIKGVIKGTGTLYVGGNLYIAGDLTYLNSPDYSTPPETMTPENRDTWVTANKSKDLVAFAVRESIYGGDVNSSEWKSYCYNASGYGLKNVGAEGTLGADGIAHTGDDGIPYLDTNGDGVADSAWYDADGDGFVDGNYDYEAQMVMDDARASLIEGYPTTTDTATGNVVYDPYSDHASNLMNRLDGVFYTNHAVGMRLKKSDTVMNGVLVSRDEAIVFNSTLHFTYDSRVHSRYQTDPNRFVDLGLPVFSRIQEFAEVAPDPTGL